jgi:hypothetical protein
MQQDLFGDEPPFFIDAELEDHEIANFQSSNDNQNVSTH